MSQAEYLHCISGRIFLWAFSGTMFKPTTMHTPIPGRRIR
ncbi:hypothetical protein BURPS1710A_0886 [Burkholderia pseudomallei 1710a]|uniref:Uncharacterized protein n=1 Tax=Burkholderia pseudomallei 1710a TaxID=320371 RepID=A0A0E1WB88_BURPE|nr:hypothetical protein BURPS1710A_0886 [Burkholderia pseudomallei 1710a]